MEKKFDVNAVDPLEGVSCLQIATGNGHLSVMELLLEAGCDADAKDRLKRTVMAYAPATDRAGVLSVISDHFARVSNCGESGDILREQTSRSRQRQYTPDFVSHIIRGGDIDAVRMVHDSRRDMSRAFAYDSCTTRPLPVAPLPMAWDQVDITSYGLERNVSWSGRACYESTLQWSSPHDSAFRDSKYWRRLADLLGTDQQNASVSRLQDISAMISLAASYGDVGATRNLLKQASMSQLESVEHKTGPLPYRGLRSFRRSSSPCCYTGWAA